ncbi:MAG: hypothetical protein U0L18_09220 [Acutalibacteraceae bacterium]|nr:hypothetical protein [Acutalibacteraceae bacterium]
MNLYDYILKVLSNNNKTVNDIHWIGNDKYKIPINDFFMLAKRTEQLNNSGTILSLYYPIDVLIVGDGWWLEYDDITDSCDIQLKFCTPPLEPENTFIISSLSPNDDYPKIKSQLIEVGEIRLCNAIASSPKWLSELIEFEKFLKKYNNFK